MPCIRRASTRVESMARASERSANASAYIPALRNTWARLRAAVMLLGIIRRASESAIMAPLASPASLRHMPRLHISRVIESIAGLGAHGLAITFGGCSPIGGLHE